MGKAAEGGLAVAQLNFGFMAAKVVNYTARSFLSKLQLLFVLCF